jgi:regulator of protease activity HflC (stomatin/prohibitin superfamily)
MIIGGVMLFVALVVGFVWTVCRVYVPANKCLVLIHKTGTALPSGEKIAGPDQKGIQRDTRGPGRYFFNPWAWDWELHDLVMVSAGDPASWKEYYAESASDTAFPKIEGKWPEIGILVNKTGKPAPAGTEVVDEGFQGIQKQVLTPGTYRINPYVFDVKKELATTVPLGCCGVVTSQLGDMPGVETVEESSVGPDGQPVKGHPKVIQKLAEAGQRGVTRDVLQPGIYYLNPYVYKVQIVQVGYNQLAQVKTKDLSTHITFPSKDGFTIDIEVIVVWGRHPSHIAEMLNRFGDMGKIKQIILGQMRSICRNLGSDYQSTDFIRGEKRELYQQAVTETLRRVCRERDIEILIALIHNIEVHGSPEADKEGMDLKSTIQRGFIAIEQDLTKQAQRETAKVKADLETSKMAVEIAREQVAADTRKKVAEIKAEGEKKSQETGAQRDLEVATLEKQIAELDAEMTRLLGRAKADVEQLKNQAEADGKRMMIAAFGSGSAYNLYKFAEGFAPDSIRLIFAGPGTFWTDLSHVQDAAGLKLLDSAQGTEKSASQNPPRR